jgi:hypothetical protein
MNREVISAGQFFLGVLGLLAWITAVLFGAIPTTVDTVVAVEGRGTANAKAPSPAGAGAACGFAVAGGLCIVAAALLHRTDSDRRADAERAKAEAEAERAEFIHEQAEKIRALEAELRHAQGELLELRAWSNAGAGTASDRPRD